MSYNGPDRRNGRATLDSLSFQLGKVEGCMKASLAESRRQWQECERKLDQVDGRVRDNSEAIAGLESGARKSARKSGGFWGGFVGVLVLAGAAVAKWLGAID